MGFDADVRHKGDSVGNSFQGNPANLGKNSAAEKKRFF
jgi:hypothetical protein